MRALPRLIIPMLLIAGITLIAIPAYSKTELRSGVLVYEVTSEQGQTGAGAREEVRVWFRAPYYRVETSFGSGLRRIAINGPDGCYMINPRQNEAWKLSKGGLADPATVPGYARSANRSLRKVAAEKVGSYEAEVFAPRTAAQRGLENYRLLVSRQFPDLTVKEVRGRADQGIRITTVLKSAQLYVAVSDRQFRLPPGLTIREMPAGPGRPQPLLGAAGGGAQSPRARLNRLAVAVRAYARAHGGTLPPMRNQRELLQALAPHLRDAESFRSPAMGPPFLPVTVLAGVPVGSLRDAHRQVMLYRARPEADGRRLVAFVDCHVEAVTPEAWQQLVREQRLPAR